MSLPLVIKVTLSISTMLYANAMLANPSPPSDSERLKPKGTEHFAVLSVLIHRLVIIIPTICEVLTILTLFSGSDSAFTRCVRTIVPYSNLANADRLALTPKYVLFCFITFLGAGIRHACYSTLGRYFTIQLSIRREHRLITTGPYSIVRHPSYTGVLVLAAGTLARHCTRGSWLREGVDLQGFPYHFGQWISLCLLIPYVGWFVERMNYEDAMLREEFGKEWELWRTKVPYRLIPGVY